MRDEVINELKKRVAALELVAKPDEVSTGMSGSLIMFRHYLKVKDVMTQEEWIENVYEDWLEEQHNRIYIEINARYYAAMSHAIE